MTTTNTNARPTHRIFRVSGEGTKSFWTPIGSAWMNRDRKGFSISCDAVPLTGRIVMREIIVKEGDKQGRLV